MITTLNSTTRYAYILIRTSEIVVNEEYYIYDFNGIVGTVGGSLGLFVGFSFLHCMLFFLSSLRNKCGKWCNIHQRLSMCWIVCRVIYVVMSAIFLHLQKVWNKMCVFLFSPMYKLILELKADHKLKMLWKFFGLAWLKACQNTIIIQIHYPLSKQQAMKYWIMLLCYNGSFGRFNNSLIMKLSI